MNAVSSKSVKHVTASMPVLCLVRVNLVAIATVLAGGELVS